jgi:hypothetical protein
VRLHQNPVRGQDRIAVEPLSEVQRGLHLGEVPHDEVGLVASPGAQAGKRDRTGVEVFDLSGRSRRSVVQDRTRLLVERQRDSRDGGGWG